MKPGAGLDSESLDLILKSLHDFAVDQLPDKVLLDLDAANEFPLEIVRELCGPDIGLSLIHIWLRVRDSSGRCRGRRDGDGPRGGILRAFQW